MTASSPPSPAPREREQALSALGQKSFDLLVIGGGITGAGVARDAALRGLSVALVEKADFASGTSSKSSKLIHGGLRYLEHAQFKLVFEGTNERALLLKRAPHLVRPLPFLVPAYRASKPGLFTLDVGLWIYDALSKFSSPKLHKAYRAPKIAALEPVLQRDNLTGGIVYYDALTDDARLTVENALDARSLGATLVTHARVRTLLRDGEGRVIGADVESDEGATATVRASVVVNATGPWTDTVRGLAGERPILKPTKGVHLVVDAARLPVRHAIVMAAKRDRRVMFAIPWGERTVIGTTDTFYDGDPDDVCANADDAAYLLESANAYFPSAELRPDDVLATWAGLRPLVSPESDTASASDVSREHEVLSSPGLVTIAGGKLTTYRRIAAEVVDAALEQLGRELPCTTADRPLPGAAEVDGEAGLAAIGQALAATGLDPVLAARWAGTYGARAKRLAARYAEDASSRAPIDEELSHVMAEVDEAVDHEMALTVVDVLSRRVPLLLRARDQGLGVVDAVARRMGERLSWSPPRVQEEADAYRAVVATSRKFRA